MKKKYFLIIVGIILLLILLVMVRKRRISKFQPPPVLDTQGKVVKRIKTITTNGGRVAWSPKGDLIAFDRKGEDGYYDVWVMKPDGSNQRCLTCGQSSVPAKHNGNPAWHPSAKYLAFQSQDPNLEFLPAKLRLVANMVSSPGGAINNNLWAMASEGSRFWQLTQIKDGMAVLHPHFSHDGRKILWAEKTEFIPKGASKADVWGEWVIKIADFKNQPEPSIINVKEIKSGDFQFYETHGFLAGDQKIIFSAFQRGKKVDTLDIFTYGLTTGELKNLTDTPNEWDEHAQISPNGSKIAWVSSLGIEEQRDAQGNINLPALKLDFWQMNLDGSGKQR